MKITLNGAQQTIETESKISDLLAAKGYDGKIVAIAVNQTFIPRSNYDTHTLKKGDDIEILAPMQGG